MQRKNKEIIETLLYNEIVNELDYQENNDSDYSYAKDLISAYVDFCKTYLRTTIDLIVLKEQIDEWNERMS